MLLYSNVRVNLVETNLILFSLCVSAMIPSENDRLSLVFRRTPNTYVRLQDKFSAASYSNVCLCEVLDRRKCDRLGS